MPSKRDRMRELAAELLERRGGAMHYTRLAESIYPELALATEPVKALNTALHDDPAGRFRRVGKGTWALPTPGGRGPR